MGMSIISRQHDALDQQVADALAIAAHTGHEALLAILLADLWRILAAQRQAHEDEVTRLRSALSYLVQPPARGAVLRPAA
jgi:hypothetical protein